MSGLDLSARQNFAVYAFVSSLVRHDAAKRFRGYLRFTESQRVAKRTAKLLRYAIWKRRCAEQKFDRLTDKFEKAVYDACFSVIFVVKPNGIRWPQPFATCDSISPNPPNWVLNENDESVVYDWKTRRWIPNPDFCFVAVTDKLVSWFPSTSYLTMLVSECGYPASAALTSSCAGRMAMMTPDRRRLGVFKDDDDVYHDRTYVADPEQVYLAAPPAFTLHGGHTRKRVMEVLRRHRWRGR